MVFVHRKYLIPVLLIEVWRLKNIGVEDHVLTTTGARFVLCCLEELGPYPVSSRALIDPEGTNITTATPGPSLDAGIDTLLGIADKECQPLSIIDASLRGIILVEAVRPKISGLQAWDVIRRLKDRSPWLSLLTVVPPPSCVYYAAIPLAQYPLPSQGSPGTMQRRPPHGPHHG
jgi:hypothetical protein